MDRLREHVRSGMSESVRVEVEGLLNAMIGEAEQRQQDLIRSVEGLEQQIIDKVNEKQAFFLHREEETERLHAEAELARRTVRVEMLEDKTFKDMKREVEVEERKKEKLRKERWALWMDNRRKRWQLEMKEEAEYDRRMPGDVDKLYTMGQVAFETTKPLIDTTLTGSHETAARKQKLLNEFRSTAAKWMESDDHPQDPETNSTIPAILKGWMLRDRQDPKTNRAIPAVLKGWMVRDRWQYLREDCKAFIKDQPLKEFTCHAEIGKLIRESEKIRKKNIKQFEKELKEHHAERERELNKIRAAEMKERKPLERIIRKEKKKQHKAEKKVKKAQEKQYNAQIKALKEQEQKHGEILLQEALAMVEAKKAQEQAGAQGEGQGQGQGETERRRWRLFSLRRSS
ncbi:DNA ligase 1-like [Engraulis encrasicolus]|uniref:DNA ligase 1-like n=1 Tax=Engraulis encrasicolus TaxID=184585 RepID=UPI002FD394CA